MTSFKRARKPEERTIRRDAILAAAAELFDEEGPQGAGLNAIAARAGFTKSNVYRYFESREEVLLSLFQAELEKFVPALEQALAACAPGDFDAISTVSTECFLSRPRFCELMTILSAVLEQNVSEAAITTMKRGASDLYFRMGRALKSVLPGATLEDCAWAGGMVASLVAGLWPSAHPAPAAARVLATPEFAHLKPVLDRDVPRALRALLVSITPAAS
jgi:AcrR family transcriptional regulator